MSDFGFDSTCDEVLSGIDLDGKVALVTGASGGLGAETARALASKGARVTLTARDTAKGEAVADAIRSTHPGALVEVEPLELSRPASVHAFAEEWLRNHEHLHLLINNAGIMACPLSRSEEGWELQFATNHLGHFLLTGLLTPALLRGAPSRIVNLSSAGHRFGPVRFDDLHYESTPYDKWEAYGQAKTANVLFSCALDRRLGSRGVHAYAVHPGGIQTDLGRHLERSDIEELMARRPGGKPIRWKTVQSGAATTVWAATTPQLSGRGGLYLEDCREGQPKSSDEDDGGYESFAVDSESAERLWTVSEEHLGVRFDFA